MNNVGYYRHATIAGSRIAFVCEDDLWVADIEDRAARRLTAGLGEITTPRLSPDGARIAFVGREEGHPEVCTIELEGASITRRTHLGGEACLVSGWRDARTVLFASDAHRPFSRDTTAYELSLEGGVPTNLMLGHVRSLAIAPFGGVVIGRNADDPARWKRYKGGTAGDLWIDPTGAGEFSRLIALRGNPVAPMWIGRRVYFLSDHEGTGNIYSCDIAGGDLTRHTDEREYYARYPSTDGVSIVYTVAGAVKVLDTRANAVRELAITAPSSAPQAARRFVPAAEYLENAVPSPAGDALAITARGQSFTMPLWEEAAVRFAGGGAVRARLAAWLHDGKRLVYVADDAGFERVHLHDATTDESRVVSTEPFGRANELVASPVDDVVAIATHRYELGLLDLATGALRVVDTSGAGRLGDLAFSPDGRYVAYAIAAAVPPAVPHTECTLIRVCEVATGKLDDVTSLLRADRSPAWDPEGRFIAFLSTRDFNPVYDALQFDLSFPQATRPFLVTLRADVPSPFVAKTSPVYRDDKDDKDDETEEIEKPGKPKIEIDFAGITGRILGFPVEEGDYGQLVAAKNRVLFTRFPLKGIAPGPRGWDDDERGGELAAYDFTSLRSGTLAGDVSEIALGADARTLIYHSENRLRVIDAAREFDDEASEPDDEKPSRRNGWLDLERISLEIDPPAEWTQMYHEAWRLQQEHFWDENMSAVDWRLVRDRYAALLPRLRARGELSDLIWEMQGELGTSHAYEIGGDYRRAKSYRRGFLGAEFAVDPVTGAYRIERILRGDSWDRAVDSPLAAPGVDARPGDVVTAIGGRKIGPEYTLDAALVNAAGRDVRLTLERDGERRTITVRALRDERALRYRAWVERNRAYVHERTRGRVGYVHIPDMGPWGFSEFHRGFLAEFNRAGLIVDARHNRGGHISPLLLEKLARKRVGYDVPRYGPPIPYPPESVRGPLVGLTDQFAGSDGDIFSHCFKLYGLGPLVGKRTWGGVVGINPSHVLVDGTVTTQPEFSFWFNDVGWGVENYGTDPDHDVDVAPQDTRAGRDPQMEKALELMETALRTAPPHPPTFTQRPSLALP